ncbi:MAG: chromosome segregation ATPase [Verrucomicrobiales bacterium]|jgi:chromosome segregation ATPase
MKKLPAILFLTSALVLPLTTIKASDPQPVATEAAKNDKEKKSKERKAQGNNKKKDNSNRAKLQACKETLKHTTEQAQKATTALAKAEEKVKTSLQIATKVQALENEVKALRIQKAEQTLTQIHTKQNTDKESSSASVKDHEAALKEIDTYLSKASSKAKELGEVIRNAKKEKALAQEESKKKSGELAKVREEMDRMVKELGEMKTRDEKNNTQLKALETKLATATQAAQSESNKLLAAGENLSAWENRAKQAEGALERTTQAMRTSLKVANEAKALGTQFQDKLTLSATQLVEKDNSLNTTLASLKKAQGTASECQARVFSLQAELDKQSKRYEVTTTALKKTESDRDSYRKSKLAAEKSLTQLKGQLATAERKAKQRPEAQKKIGALEATINSQKEAETRRGIESEHLAKASKQMKTRLDEILMQREELNDHLTILRNEFAQYRITTKNDQDRFAKASVNQLQASLAQESTKYNSTLQQRDKRLAELEETLKAKETALQAAYEREKEASSKLVQDGAIAR